MSRLLESGEEIRKQMISKNTYNKNDEYINSHKNALSDGDDKGRGEVNGRIGTATDIQQRESMVAKNMYNSNNEYGESGTV